MARVCSGVSSTQLRLCPGFESPWLFFEGLFALKRNLPFAHPEKQVRAMVTNPVTNPRPPGTAIDPTQCTELKAAPQHHKLR